MSETHADLAARLQRLEDIEAIKGVIVRYCRGVDRAEPRLILDAFHDDATDNHYGILLPFREAIGSLKNPTDPNAPPPNIGTNHIVCNMLIDLDGDVAHCETYLVAVARMPHAGKLLDWTLGGRYVDRFERREDRVWRIASRTVAYDFERFDEVKPAPDGFGPANYIEKAVRGVRGAADFSYREFGPRKG